MDDQFAPPPPPPPPGDFGQQHAPPPEVVSPGAPSPPSQTWEQPGPYTGAPYPAGQGQPPAKKSKAKIVIVIVAAVLLLCCCVSGGVAWWLIDQGDSEIGDISRSLPDTSEPAAMVTNDEGYVGQSGNVAVWLSWEEPVDMDLELWDEAGNEFLLNAYAVFGEDIIKGTLGDEYFEFKSTDYDDFSFGSYVVSAYFADIEATTGDEAWATITVQDVDGRVTTYSKLVLWEPGYDQWHAFRIDAATGDVTPIDDFH